MNDKSDDKASRELKRLDGRLRKIEDYLWPPIDPPSKPKGPIDDPPVLGPGELGKKLAALSKKVDELDGRAATREEVEELRGFIAQLSREIAALNDTMQLLARYMQVPG